MDKTSSPLASLAKSFIDQAIEKLRPEVSMNITLETRNAAFLILCEMLKRKRISNSDDFAQRMMNTIGTSEPVLKIQKILNVPNRPLQFSQDAYVKSHISGCSRKWSDTEDLRLLAAINHYGLNDWVNVAKFVGNDRKKSQCSQRWNRVLNPDISKTTWTEEEDKKLMDLILELGDKSWCSISKRMNKRSDAQCRYRYLTALKNKMQPPSQQINNINTMNINLGYNNIMNDIKPNLKSNSENSHNLKNDQIVNNPNQTYKLNSNLTQINTSSLFELPQNELKEVSGQNLQVIDEINKNEGNKQNIHEANNNSSCELNDDDIQSIFDLTGDKWLRINVDQM